MKKTYAFVMAVLTVLTASLFTGCGEKDTKPEEPFFVMAAMADLHIDYGVQEFTPPIRPGTVLAFDEIKGRNVCAVAILGDITSNTTGKGINALNYQEVMDTVSSLAKASLESRRVLYVTGNHDFVAGGKNFNSGDYAKIMRADIGEFAAYIDQDNEFTEKNQHVLGYHYVLDGVDVIGINTPYEAGDKHSDYYYYPESIDWLDEELGKIGADKTVIILGHYPLSDSKNVTKGKYLSDTYDTQNKVKRVLVKYPNAIYLYGHDHGGRKIKEDVFERITPYDENGEVMFSKTETPKGFITAFAGSVAYFDGALGVDDYDCVQYLLVKMYSDRIVFEMVNVTGPAHDGMQELETYTVMRDLSGYVGK